MALAPIEETGIGDEAVFRHLGVAGAHLAFGQGVEGGGIGQDQTRLVEGADQVLAQRRVDAGLAAHRGIDLGEQGRGCLDEADAAPERRRREAGEIADHAAAEGHHQVVALDPVGEEAVAHLCVDRIAFRGLARRHGDETGAQARRLQALAQAFTIEAHDRLVGHDGGGPRAEGGHACTRLGEEAPPDMDVVVAALVEGDVDRLSVTHCAATPWFEGPLR